MRRDFVDTVSQMLQIKRRDLIEKDLILHQILLDISHDKYIADNTLRLLSIASIFNPRLRSFINVKSTKTTSPIITSS